MAQYDGSIRINTQINIKNAEAQLDVLGASISKSTTKIADLRSKLDSLKTVQIPTEEYSEISAQIEKARHSLDGLLEKQAQMQAEGKTSGASWDRIVAKIAETRNELSYANGELQALVDEGKAFTVGDPAQEEKLSQQLQAEEARLASMTQKRDLLNSKVQAAMEEEQRLASIKENATVTDQKLVDLLERRRQLLIQIKDLEKAGVTEGYAEYDNALAELSDIQSQINGIRDMRDAAAQARQSYVGLGETVRQVGRTMARGFVDIPIAAVKAGVRGLISGFQKLGGVVRNVAVNSFRMLGNAIRTSLSRVGSLVGNVVSKMKLLGTTAKKSFSNVNKSAKKTGGLMGTIASRFKGIALSLLLFNWVTKAFNGVVKSIKDGFGNLYKDNERFKASVDDLRASVLTLKNAFAAAFRPLVDVAIPYIQMAADKMTELLNKVGQFTAAITGQTTYTKAIKQTADAFKDAKKAAEGYLSPLDEINKFSSKKDEGEEQTGVMFEEVPIEQKFKDMAQKVKDVFKDLFAPIKDAWDKEGDFVIDSWKYGLGEIKKLLKDIGRDFLNVWKQPETIKIFEDILHIIGDIGLAIGNLASRFREAWNENDTGLHILENIRDIIGVIVANIRHAADVTVEWSKNLDFSPLLTKVMEWTASLVPVFDSLSGILTDFYEKVLLPLGQWVLEKGLPDLLQVFIDFNNLVDWENLRSNFDTLWEHLEPFAETVGEGLIIFIERVSDALANFLNSQEFKDFLVTVENWMDSVTPEDVADALEMIAKSLIALKLALLGYSAIKGITGIFGTIKSFLAIFGVGGSAAKTAANMDMVAASIGGLSTALTALAGVAAVAGSYKLLTGHLEELFAAFGKSTDQGRRLEERYEGLDGAARFAKDGIDTLKNGIEGYGFAADNCVGSGVALEKAMEDIQNGAILTDEHMEELQNRFSLTDEDMEMLRQEMLDCNPILREIADNLGFEDASPETLQDIAEGFGMIANGVEPLPDDLANMTEEARGFMERVMESETPMVVFGEKLENIGAISDNTSKSLNETGKSISDGLMKGMEEADVEAGSENLFSRLIGKIKELFGIHSPSTVMAEIGGFIVEGMLNGIMESLKSIGSWVREHIFQPFIDGFKNAFDIHSPSGVMESMGRYIIEGLLNGLKNMWGSITSWIEDKVNWIIDKFRSVKEKVSGFFSGGGSGDYGQNYSSRSYSMRSLSAPYVHPAIAKLSNIEIPKLATGAVLPANREFLALVGDQKHGTNVEAPLDTIRQAAEEAVLNVFSRIGMSGGNMGGTPVNLTLQVALDGQVIGQKMVDWGKLQQMATGVNPYELGTT